MVPGAGHEQPSHSIIHERLQRAKEGLANVELRLVGDNIRQIVANAGRLVTFTEQRMFPGTSGLQQALSEQLTPVIDAHLPQTDQATDQARAARIAELRTDLIIEEPTAQAIDTIGTVLFEHGVVIPEFIDRYRGGLHDTPGDDYQAAAKLGTILIQTAQRVLSKDPTNLLVLDAQPEINPATQMSEEQQSALRKALTEALRPIAKGARLSVPQLLDQSSRDIAVTEQNLALYDALSPVHERYDAIEEAAVGRNALQFFYHIQNTVVNGLAVVDSALTTERSRQAHIAQEVYAPNLRALDRMLQPYRDDLKLGQRTVEAATIVHGLLEAFLPPAYFREQSQDTQPLGPINEYRTLVRQIHEDFVSFPGRMEEYFAAVDAYEIPYLEDRAQRFGIPTEVNGERRSNDDLRTDLRQARDFVWLTLAHVLNLDTPGSTIDAIGDAVISELQRLSTKDVAVAEETVRIMRTIEDTGRAPSIDVTFQRRRPFPEGHITISPFRRDGTPITEDEAEKVFEHHSGRAWAAQRRGFAN